MQIEERELAEYIKEIADIETVAEYLGLKLKKQGRKSMILCPCHNDQHFGSCFLTDNRFYCYSCNSGGDVIQLVQIIKNISFFDACQFIAEIYGQTIEKGKKRGPIKRVLSAEKLRLIGLGRDRNAETVWQDNAASAYLEDLPEPEANQRIHWEPIVVSDDELSISPNKVDSRPQGYYILQTAITKNPLQDLLENDEDTYNDLICRKAEEAAQKYREMITMAINPAQYYSENDIGPLLIAHLCSEVANKAGMSVWQSVMNQNIRKCDDIRIEHGSKRKPENEKNIKRKNVFGKVRGGALF